MQEDFSARWGAGARSVKTDDVAKLMKYVDDNVIGKGNTFCGPYGRRKIVYCDYIDCGRALRWLEEYVSCEVLPALATTTSTAALSHTTTQSQLYRSESRAIIRGCIGAGADDVVAVGASLTSVLRTLAPALGQVTVFVSARDTNSQLAPWLNCGAEIIRVPETKDGFIDLNLLEQRLQEYSETGRRMIGYFPAASKITGVLADDVATTLLLHQYGAKSFWEYDLLAPYCGVDINPAFPGVDEAMVRKDGVFLDCEKYAGGAQGPRVAILKKDIFRNSPFYCEDVEMLSERVEECRCVEGVRCALALRLQEAVGPHNIMEKVNTITRQVVSHARNIPELILLGTESTKTKRLPIFSIMVKHPRGTFLHHNFVCAVLNDVFGIQARGGSYGSMYYGADLLGIDEQLLKEYEKLLDVEMQREISRVRKLSDAKSPEIPIHNEHLRPGFCSLSLPYFISESELAFVLEALKMVATEGWKILPQYAVDPHTGLWRHHTCSVFRDRKSLYSLRFNDGKVTANERRISGPGVLPQSYTECLQTARNLFNRARKLALRCSAPEPEGVFNPRIDYLRWFMLPKEAHDLLLGKSSNVKHIVPFDPSGYTGARQSIRLTRSSLISSPVLGSSPRHYSLSAIDDCQLRFKQKQAFLSRESSLKEDNENSDSDCGQPVKFAIGESVSPLRLEPWKKKPFLTQRYRCYSLGSDNPCSALSPQTKNYLGIKETSLKATQSASSFCNCGSQTDLQSLDEPLISPGKDYLFNTHTYNPVTGYSHIDRGSPTGSICSQTSEEIHPYVKEMTAKLATEIKSEIREVISKVDDILDNSDSVDQNVPFVNMAPGHCPKASVSVCDVAEYIIGMSKEMATEFKYEIREMVNQVDELISPEYSGTSSRKTSPPQTCRPRIGSGPELGLNLKKPQSLRKCTTSPELPSQSLESRGTPKKSPLATSSNDNLITSSETSTPDTIIQVLASDSPNMPKSLSSAKLSDDETCADMSCRQCTKKTISQNASVSSQDSGINMAFPDSDGTEFVKWRTSSDPTASKKKCNKLRSSQIQEKSEVPDIIEGVPVCSEDPKLLKSYAEITADTKKACGSRKSAEFKRSNRSNASSSSSDHSSRSSGYVTDSQRKPEDHCPGATCGACWLEEEEDDSSACSDASLTDFTFDESGDWRCPTKPVWKGTVEAIQEYNMIRNGDKVLVCLSGGRHSIALLHTLHQYQLYARAKGVQFTMGALFVHEVNSDVDPLHLMAYCRDLGVKFIYQDKVGEEDHKMESLCEVVRWSDRNVRSAARAAAASHGFGVAALAQALDDAAAAFLAAAIHGDTLATLKPHYSIRGHNVREIRPFIAVRECDLAEFAGSAALPQFRGARATSRETSVVQDSCGHSAAAQLECARSVLATLGPRHPRLLRSMGQAIRPLLTARYCDKTLKEHRQRKKSVIQMKNGAPVYDSDSEEELV